MEQERLKKQILKLFPTAQRVEIGSPDRLEWRIVVWDSNRHRISDWIGRCDGEIAALMAAYRWFNACPVNAQ